MGTKERLEEYLAKAKAAEERAEKTTDEAAKASWLRIAAGYHDLARNEDPVPKP